MDRGRPGFGLLAFLNAAAACRDSVGPWASCPPGRSLGLLPAGKFLSLPLAAQPALAQRSTDVSGARCYINTRIPICPSLPHPPQPQPPPELASRSRHQSSRAAGPRHPRSPAAGVPRMVRKQGKGSRGPGMANAKATRSSKKLIDYEETEEGITIAEVPCDLLLKKKAGKYGPVSARRAVMRAKMSQRCGVTGFGCVPGCIATIVYPLTELESTFLNSMGEENAVEVAGDAALGVVPQI